jgi:hypothetical protein
MISIEINSPPSFGSFLINPTVGIELQDLFYFTANDWIDEDLPLLYSFGFFVAKFK